MAIARMRAPTITVSRAIPIAVTALPLTIAAACVPR
jgi:hypothetical protein